MQEGQVTVDGNTHLLPSPFAVVATQNPIEYEGTYRSRGTTRPVPPPYPCRYPDRDAEWDVIRRRADAAGTARPCSGRDARTVLSLREAVERVELSEPVGRYLVDVVGRHDLSPVWRSGEPPRLSRSAAVHKGRAALQGRDFVLPDDIKALAVACLAHRLTLLPDLWLRGSRPRTSFSNASTRCPCQLPTTSEPTGSHSEGSRVRRS